MKLIAGMNYRQWQIRNTEHFNSLNKSDQKEARQQGYCNIGWNKVQDSWKIICKLAINVPTLFERKLRKGNIIDAIKLPILEAEKAKHIARQAINILDKNQQHFDKLADEALAKYPLL